MRTLRHLYLLLLIFLGTANAALLKPTKPREDPFYDFPSNISDYNEGDIVKWRNTPQVVHSLLFPINVKNSWQFMVRSTNSQGEPIGVVATLLEPYDADNEKMVVYSFAEDSASADCAPSYSLLYGSSVTTIALQIETLYMDTLLTKGWYVLAADYEGVNAAFCAGRLAGMANLDAIRGALGSTDISGLKPSAEVVMWGFSGGTIPSSWAAALQPSYAPELSQNLIGVAVGGWVSNISRTLDYLDGSLFAGFVASGILGISTEYPEVNDEIFSFVREDEKATINETYYQCLVQTIVTFPYTEYFIGDNPVCEGGRAVLERPEVKAMIEDNILVMNKSVGLPEIPMFVYHGIPDEIVPFENSVEAYEKYCEWGIESFEFAVSNTTGHILEYVEGGAAAMQWIANRFEGKDAVQGCELTERTSNLEYPGVGQSFYEIVRTTWDAFQLDKLGPQLFGNDTISPTEEDLFELIRNFIQDIGRIPVKRDERL